MLYLFIKEFTLIACSLFTFNRVINISTRKNRFFFSANIILLALITVLSIISEKNFHINTLTIQIAVSFLSLAIIYGISLELSFVSSIISYAISYIIYIIFVLFTSMLFAILNVNQQMDLIYPQTLIGVFQLLSVFFLFRIKRLQKGMPFLYTNSNHSVLYLSGLTLFSYIILSNNNGELIYLLPAILILLFSIFLFTSWKNQVAKSYLQKLHKRHVNTLEQELKTQATIISELEYNLDSISRIIHRDNKLIPSMLMAVNNYLKLTDNDLNPAQIKQNGIAILEELNRVSHERNGMLSNYEISSQKLITTNIVSIDALMNYMLKKSKENNIHFEFTGSNLVSNFIENSTLESDSNTLLADLIDNAIIATIQSERRNILVDINKINEFYCISILDSGTPFSLKVLKYFGKKYITTHKETNGSGIGLMTTYEIVKNHQASFVLEEYDDNHMFTKKLSIIFDNQQRFIIRSFRASNLSEHIKRTDLLITFL